MQYERGPYGELLPYVGSVKDGEGVMVNCPNCARDFPAFTNDGSRPDAGTYTLVCPHCKDDSIVLEIRHA